jgi:hypothetical protein
MTLTAEQRAAIDRVGADVFSRTQQGAMCVTRRADLATLLALAQQADTPEPVNPAAYHYYFKDPFGSGQNVVRFTPGPWNGQMHWKAVPLYEASPASAPVTAPATQEAPKTFWVVEEAWSGLVHYVRADFDAVKWRRDMERPLRRQARQIVTKEITEAMTFDTQEAAEKWLAEQPKWMSKGGTHRVREHEWVGGA